LQEVAAMFPSSDEPTLVVSLGTGSRRLDDVPRMSPSRGILKDGFIPRLFRAFMLSMSNREGHKFRSRHTACRKEQYFRFDIEFEGPEPGLDDTTKIPELKAAAQSAIDGSKEVDRLARCIIAEYFLFELEAYPQRGKNGSFDCVGHILCRLPANTAAFPALMDQLTKTSAKLFFQEQPLAGSIGDGSFLDKNKNFKKRISFSVLDKRSAISIVLQEGSSQPCNISGAPFTLNHLIKVQGLDCYFGTADHQKRKRINTVISPSKRQRSARDRVMESL
jgi:hypothetical protein